MAGIGLDGLQPPGSTFKMVTLTGALAAHVADPKTVFPYATYAVLDGVKLHNANGEECGGTLEHAFAVSCNSVFTPLGVKLGAARLVQTAEAFGFNQTPDVPGAAESTLPAASQIHGELDVGSTAIGQGQVVATPLQMATVAATIADGGRRPRVTFTPGARRVRHARHERLGRAHRAAADDRRGALGHGHRRGDSGVVVAGKTGTAELKSACSSAEGSEPERRIRLGRLRSRKAIRATPTRGSPRSRPPCTRGSRCACCSSKTARAERRRPLSRVEVIEAGLQSGL